MLDTTRETIVEIICDLERISWELRRLAHFELTEAVRQLENSTEAEQLQQARRGLEYVASDLEDLTNPDQDT